MRTCRGFVALVCAGFFLSAPGFAQQPAERPPKVPVALLGPALTYQRQLLDAVKHHPDPAAHDLVVPDVFPGGPMATDVPIVYLHHSTGGVIWDGGVPDALQTYNTAHGTSYQITEQTFPSTAEGYPWANYPYDYWNLWINHEGMAGYMGESTLEMLTPQYTVVVFKHCFPVSAIGPDTGNPDIASEDKTIENYELQYNALRDKLHQFPSNRFIVWTGAALTADSTDTDSAARSRQFFTWVKEVWDQPADNIFVWDFYELETEGGNVLLDQYASSPDDSHPNAAFAARVAPLFVNRLISVIQGTGDSTSLTGQSGGGDANGDGTTNVQDVFYLINGLFAGGPAPIGSGDANGDGTVNVQDVFYLINYLFAGGPAPV